MVQHKGLTILTILALVFALSIKGYRAQEPEDQEQIQEEKQDQVQEEEPEKEPEEEPKQEQGQQQQDYGTNLEALKEDFKALDKNEDGYVDAHELRSAIPGISEDDITSFFDRYDADRDAVISLEEYLMVIHNTPQEPQEEEPQERQEEDQTVGQ